MDNKEKYKHWLKIAIEDLEIAGEMFNSGRYGYVTFMCQQAIEKLAKGTFVYNFNKEAKYTHNINFVLEEIENIANLQEYDKYKRLFSDLVSYYIVARYDTYKHELMKELDNEKTKKLLNETKEAFSWLKSQVKL